MAGNSINNINEATANEWYANGWYRVNGGGGIYWQQFGGGWNMVDGTWLRTYGDKPILASGGIAGYGNNVFGNPFGTNPRMYANYDNAAGGGIMVADDGGFFDFNDAWIQFRGSTGLQIRTNDPNWAILVNTGDVNGAGTSDKRISPSTNAWGLVGNSGNAWWQMWAYSFTNASDERVKKDIEDLGEAEMREMLDRLDSIRSVRFRYNEETTSPDPEKPAKYREHPHVGVIAQSMPEEVLDTSGPVLGINLADTIGYTIVALRGLRAETREVTNDLYEQIKQRDKQIEDLERRVSELEGKR
ncbi:MAG: tail fiber domain-containing protein [Polyangiaceae bacterium]|nr:tail fiber domain-containing protein [Polyangiaceae bacterium]NUQ76187.1 tail fiber domain-containing protein [Polyangiaceae bacterium]